MLIGNPIASLVSKLMLDRNKVVVRLSCEDPSQEDDQGDEDSDSTDDESSKQKKSPSTCMVEIEIDLSLSAHANANRLYHEKKVARSKEEKTAQATERAVRAVEEQMAKQLKSQKIKRNLQAVRKVHWFEKFNWFVTSEGYLVLSGRDAQQNEALVKRYLRPGDAYVHADIHGASSCIVRCKVDKDTQQPLPISPFALQEAGTMTICRSGAWAVKVVTSAWWVHSSQVSKTAPSGEYLTTGSFMIYGRKNFLPPTNLEMGFGKCFFRWKLSMCMANLSHDMPCASGFTGILFRLDDSSVTRHAGERKERSVEFENESEDARSIMSERYSIDMEAVADPALFATAAASASRGAVVPGLGVNEPAPAVGNTKGPKTAGAAASGSTGKLSAHEKRMLKKAARKGANGQGGGDGAAGGDKTLPQVKEEGSDVEDEGGLAESQASDSATQELIPCVEGKSMSEGEKSLEHKQKGKNPNTGQQKQQTTQKQVQANNKQQQQQQKKSSGGSAAEAAAGGIKRKKAPNKKKARRYANQDEEDLELAMQALGHANFGSGGASMSEIQQEEIEEAKRQEKLRKQEKVRDSLFRLRKDR